MTAAQLMLAVMWVGLTLYVLFAGADFGAGCWDLLAGRGENGARQRDLIAHSIGPVWEANHVWLIFVIVLLWTGFPTVFAAVASTAYIPLTLAALGIIGRGAAFAFRKEAGHEVLFGAVFAFSSVVTPFFLGTVAGAVATGRIPLGTAAGDVVTSWWNPTSVLTGLLGTGVCAYLAAVFLTRDAARRDHALAEQFRRRALAAGLVVGALSLAGLLVDVDLPAGFVAGSVAAGVASLVLLWFRRYVAVRVTAALAVATLLWGWGVGQYPELLPGATVRSTASDDDVLTASLIALAVGAVIVVPSLYWLYSIFQREPAVSRGAGPRS